MNQNKQTIQSSNKLAVAGILLMAVSIAVSSCKKDDPKKPVATNPQEVLTTIILEGYNHDEPNNPKYQFTYKWEDIDGEGAKAPTIDTLALDTGIEYHCHVLILDKTKSPIDTVSIEIEKEKDAHQFFYTPSANLAGKFSTEILDFDDNNPKLPVGLEFHLMTMSEQKYVLPLIGSLNIVLSHYDGVQKTSSKSDESDIDITFPVKLK